jgi:hypothetical protein
MRNNQYNECETVPVTKAYKGSEVQLHKSLASKRHGGGLLTKWSSNITLWERAFTVTRDGCICSRAWKKTRRGKNETLGCTASSLTEKLS